MFQRVFGVLPLAVPVVLGLSILRVDGANLVAAPGFETPVVPTNSFNYAFRNEIPAGGPWTFVDRSGLLNGSNAFGTTPPEGHQVAFIQGVPGFVAKVFQPISFPTTGQYHLTYKEASRSTGSGGSGNWGGNLTYDIDLDAIVIGTRTTPDNQTYFDRSFDFTTTAGTHTLAFIGTFAPHGDDTVFLESVSITAIPEPTSLSLLGAGFAILLSRKGVTAKRIRRQ